MARLLVPAGLVLAIATVSAAQADDAAALVPTPLPKVTVTARYEPEGYQANRSRTATKTDTPLLDVPQSVSVINMATAEIAEAQAQHGDVEGAVRTAVGILAENPSP